MTPTLRVDPPALRAAASSFAELGTSATGVGQPLDGLSPALRGMSSAAACQRAGSALDRVSRRVGDQYATLAIQLGSAADAYERGDADASGAVKKAGEPDGGKGGGDAPPPVSGGSGPEAIPVDQVTYDKGNWPSGADATRDAIDKALDQRGVTDPAARKRWTEAYLTLVQHESSHVPMAVNNWDSNAKPPRSTYKVSDGYGNGSARGLAQCVPGTFAGYHQPGTSNDIYDPVANVAASMNYLVGSYHVNPDGSDILAKVGQANPNVHQGY